MDPKVKDIYKTIIKNDPDIIHIIVKYPFYINQFPCVKSYSTKEYTEKLLEDLVND